MTEQRPNLAQNYSLKGKKKKENQPKESELERENTL